MPPEDMSTTRRFWETCCEINAEAAAAWALSVGGGGLVSK